MVRGVAGKLREALCGERVRLSGPAGSRGEADLGLLEWVRLLEGGEGNLGMWGGAVGVVEATQKARGLRRGVRMKGYVLQKVGGLSSGLGALRFLGSGRKGVWYGVFGLLLL